MAASESNGFNLVDYAKTNIKTFDECPINEGDCFVFSVLMYISHHESRTLCFSPDGLALHELWRAEYFDEILHRVFEPEATLELIAACAANPRFRDVRFRYFRNETSDEVSLQFAAGLFSISDTLHVVAYRGTDWSITGWKENILLGLKTPIPGQLMATDFLNSVAEKCEGDLILAGHSKGGNLAVYAGANCDGGVQARIKKIYSFDGPGFWQSSLRKPEFEAINDRGEKYCPSASYFGMLFTSLIDPIFIASNVEGVAQHNPFTWQLKPTGKFVLVQQRDSRSVSVTVGLNEWFDTLTEEEMKALIQAVYNFLQELGINNIEEIMDDPGRLLPDAFRALSKVSKEDKAFVQYALHIAYKGRKPTFLGKYAKAPEMPEVSFKTYTDSNEFEKEFALFI